MKDYMVSDLLENYNKYKAQVNMIKMGNIPSQVKEELEDLKESLETLEVCIAGLPQEDGELIRMFFFNGISGRRLAQKLCMSRATIYRKKDRAIIQIAENFNKFLKNWEKMR